MERRKFLKHTVSASILTIGGISAFQYHQQSLLQSPNYQHFDFDFLSKEAQILLEILIPVFVSGLSLQQSGIPRIMQNIDDTAKRLPLRSQKELKELFELLGSGFGRLMVANVWLNWQSASSKSIEDFLSSWKESQLELLQVAYKGLHKLITGAVYAEASVWSQIGYAGPPDISLSTDAANGTAL